MLKPSDTSQSKSMGALSKKGGLTGLVRVKSSNDPAIEPTSMSTQTGSITNKDITQKTTPNGLALLGTYSDSDSE
jgi:hypothetical protein